MTTIRVAKARRIIRKSAAEIVAAYDADQLGINNIGSSICYYAKAPSAKSKAKLAMWEEAKQIILDRNEPLKYRVSDSKAES